MIRSMTGYGRAQESIGGRNITVEIKSVNHRYFEFSSRVPRGYGFLEEKLKSFVQSRVTRGKIDVFVQIENLDDKDVQVQVNPSLAKGYINAMKELAASYGIEDDVTVSTLARYSDIFTVHKEPDDEDEIWEGVCRVADAAVEKFVAMRETEGSRLYQDVMSRAKQILSYVEEIETRSPRLVEEYNEKLKERLRELLGDTAVDPQRLLTEAAVFADKIAVAEETVRLRSHFDQMSEILGSGTAVGRKLDFIVQEMNREANTIGSKIQDARLAHVVVDIKAEIEKIREQIQNIE